MSNNLVLIFYFNLAAGLNSCILKEKPLGRGGGRRRRNDENLKVVGYILHFPPICALPKKKLDGK